MNKERVNGYQHGDNNNNSNFCQQLFPKGNLECFGIFPAYKTGRHFKIFFYFSLLLARHNVYLNLYLVLVSTHQELTFVNDFAVAHIVIHNCKTNTQDMKIIMFIMKIILPVNIASEEVKEVVDILSQWMHNLQTS